MPDPSHLSLDNCTPPVKVKVKGSKPPPFKVIKDLDSHHRLGCKNLEGKQIKKGEKAEKKHPETHCGKKLASSSGNSSNYHHHLSGAALLFIQSPVPFA